MADSFVGLSGRVVIVAGGGGGIGSEVAALLADCGARVVVADIDQQRAEVVAQALGADGAEALGVRVDLSDQGSVSQLFELVQARLGTPYGLVNCVGVVGVGSALEAPLSEYQRQFEVNCLGAIRLARGFVSAVVRGAGVCTAQPAPPVLQPHAPPEPVRGSLVYISSIAAELAIPERGPYCVSKAAGQLFHLNLANEVAQHDINVTVVLPGRTDTPAAAARAELSPQIAAQMFATQRRPAMIPTQTIAKTCVFLLAPHLVGCSGQKFTVAEGADTTYRPSYEALARLHQAG